MITKRFLRDEYKVYVTQAPFELDGFITTVDPGTYNVSGIDESVAYYVAQKEPSFNVEGYSFTVAKIGDWYEDDYTKIEVTETEILFTEK